MWLLVAITLILVVLFFAARQLAAPSMTILIDEDGKTTVTIVPPNLECRRRVLFLLSYISEQRARLPDELPQDTDPAREFDEFVGQVLVHWDSVPNGSALESDLANQLIAARKERKLARYFATLDMSGRLAITASAIDRPCDLASVKLHFLALLVAIAQPLSDSHQAVLRSSLEAWHTNRNGLPLRGLTAVGRVRLAEHCLRCFEVALKSESITEAETAAGAQPTNWSYVFTRWALLAGQCVRFFSFLSYPLLWMIGIRDPLALIGYGVLAHIALHAIGGMGMSVGLGTKESGEYSWVNLLANHLAIDAQLYMALSPLAGIAIAIASWIKFRDFQTPFGLLVASTLACLAIGWLLLSIAKVVKASTFPRKWHKRRSDSHGAFPPEVPLPALPLINLLLSHVYLSYFLIFFASFSAMGLIVSAIFPQGVLRNAEAPLWQKITVVVVIAVFVTLWKGVNSRITQWVFRACKSQMRVLVLRRFTDWASQSVRKIVAPILGSLGQLSIVYDPTYADARPMESPDIETVERLLDQLSDYSSVIKIEGEWQPRVRELIQETHLCVIDVSEVGDGVAWEIRTALDELSAEQIILVASYDAAIQSEDNLFDEVCDAVLSLTGQDEWSMQPGELQEELMKLRSPLLYGEFPLSTLFRLHLYRVFWRLRSMQKAARSTWHKGRTSAPPT